MEKQAEFFNMLKSLYAVDEFQGYGDEDIDYIKQLFGDIPKVLEEYYRTAGRTEEFHNVQDIWLLPEHFKNWKWTQETEYMILLNENQGVCCAGIKREDLSLENPPVYVTSNDKDWLLCADSVSGFLSAALAYEAAFTFKFCPKEFYWISEEEFKSIESRLNKYPFELKNWLDMKLMLYYSDDKNLVAVMDCGDLQMLYGASSEKSYRKLLDSIGDLGEAM